MPQVPRVTLFYGLTAPRGVDVRTGRPHRFSSGHRCRTSRHNHFFWKMAHRYHRRSRRPFRKDLNHGRACTRVYTGSFQIMFATTEQGSYASPRFGVSSSDTWPSSRLDQVRYPQLLRRRHSSLPQSCFGTCGEICCALPAGPIGQADSAFLPVPAPPQI